MTTTIFRARRIVTLTAEAPEAIAVRVSPWIARTYESTVRVPSTETSAMRP